MTKKEIVDAYLEKYYNEIITLQETGVIRWNEIVPKILIQDYLKNQEIDFSLSGEYVRERMRYLKQKVNKRIPFNTKLHVEGGIFIGDKLEPRDEKAEEIKRIALESTSSDVNKPFCYEYKENAEKKTAQVVTEIEVEIKTAEELFEHLKLDKNKWKITNWWCKRSSTGRYAVSANLKNIEVSESDDYIKKFEDFVKNYNQSIFIRRDTIYKSEEAKKERSKDNVLYLCNLVDLHIGNYQKKGYTQKIKERIFETFNSITNATNRIVIANLGDIVHTDTSKSQTWDNTQLYSEIPYEDAFTEGLDLLTSLIDYAASKVENVTFINVRGNHSFDTEFCLGEALKRIYKGQKNIEIINQKDTRIYYYWNNNAFLFTHGDKGIDSLPLVFATEGKEVFQKAENHHILLGHLHFSKQKQFVSDTGEFAGISVRVLGSPTSNDVWHKKNGFVQNKKSLISMLFTPEEGKYAEFQFKIS